MKIFKLRQLLTFISLLLFSLYAFARAGGAGGGHSGGGHSSGFSGNGGGGGGGDLFLIFYLLQSPGGWMILIIAAVIFYFYMRNQMRNGGITNSLVQSALEDSATDDFQEAQTPLTPEQLQEFKSKAATAFQLIQEAWSAKDTRLMRRFITDGIYQRFNAQFTMMNLLDQTNIISNLEILQIKPLQYAQEGDYECIDVAISAEADDQFVSQKFSQFNSPGGREAFTEIWSFLRRKDCTKTKDIFSSDNCPKCSAPLTAKLMETARCPYCGAYINSGEFDWVLSSISQEFLPDSEKTRPTLQQQVLAYKIKDPRFSRHILEDRASNAFLQVLIGLAEKNVKRVQRFSTPEFYQQTEQRLTAQNFIYDRLYLSSVSLISLDFLDPQKVQAQVAISYSFLRVEVTNNYARSLDQDENSQTCTLVLRHEISERASKGSIYANACPSCGGTQKDSLNSTCEYCGSVLNDPKGDWIVSGMNF